MPQESACAEPCRWLTSQRSRLRVFYPATDETIELAGKRYWQEGQQYRPFRYVPTPVRRFLPPAPESAQNHVAQISFVSSASLLLPPCRTARTALKTHSPKRDRQTNPESGRRHHCHERSIRNHAVKRAPTRYQWKRRPTCRPHGSQKHIPATYRPCLHDRLHAGRMLSSTRREL